MPKANRADLIERLKTSPEISVLIVGAGVNGIGTFRDLALQGVDVVMVDRADFCSGASAASSHMVHGGIRYLENGEFRLVREAVQERNRLIENAPHLVEPLPTVFPIFKWFSGLLNAPLKFLGLLDRPAERGAVVIKLGMLLYDAYTRQQGTVPKHRIAGRAATLRKHPQLNPEIIFTGTYYDAAMPSPERICMDLIGDATLASDKAIALNYLSLHGSDGQGVRLKDEMAGESFSVRPKVLVNAAGPWIDFANQRLGSKTKFIGGTKGSHIVIDNPELRQAIGEHEFFFENRDGRIVLIFPLMDKVMLGTSDIRIENPDEAHCTNEEVDYFLTMLKRVFPNIQVDRSQIKFSFSGVRPLPRAQEGSTAQISRDHSIRVLPLDEPHDFPVLSLVGGKWTTFRAFSEQVTDRVLEHLGVQRKKTTRTEAIGGGKDYPIGPAEQRAWIANLAETHKLPRERCEILFERYGTKAREFAQTIASSPDEAIPDLPTYSSGEIRHLAKEEWVQHLDDLILRRTMLAKLGLLTAVSLEALAATVGEVRGWTPSERETEIQRAKDILLVRHAVEI